MPRAAAWSFEYQRKQAFLWPLVVLCSVGIHTLVILALDLAFAAPLRMPTRTAALEPSIETRISPTVGIAAWIPRSSMPDFQSPLERFQTSPAKPLAVAPAPVSRPPPGTPADPKPAAEKKPDGDTAGVKAIPRPAPYPLPEMAVADDAAKGQDKPPEKPKYAGATNTEAADMGPKDKPRGDPFQDNGETNVVRYSGRRGEADTTKKQPDPLSGSVAREGHPEAGKPPLPKPERDHTGETATPTRTPEKKSPPEDVALAQPPRTGPRPGVTDATPVAPPKATDPKKPGPPDLKELGRSIPGAGTEEEPKRAPDAKETAGGAPLPEAPRGKPLRPAVDTPPRTASGTKPTTDPELARLEEQLRKLASGEGDPAADRPGVAGRFGEDGHAGDGSLRPGVRNAISDVIAFNRDTSAEKWGETAFSKAADPELAYLKEFLGRVNSTWKANLAALDRTRLWIGVVTVRISLDHEGKLLEALPLRHQKGLEDEAVSICQESIRQAAPHDPFPSNLSGKDKVSIVVNFLY